MDVKKCQIRNEESKATVKKAKETIKNKLWTLLWLRVDIPKIGGFGSINDENITRREFLCHEKMSMITGVDK